MIDSEAVNAFAVPGGYIYFTREILAHFNNEAQFAGVMAHEIAHIAARHSAQLITRAQLAQFFHTLDRLRPGNVGGLPGWFSTHPAPQDRVEDVATATEEWQEKVEPSQFRVGRNDYLRRIDGIVFGKNPRHGFVEEGVFYHPEFRFRFPVPRKWEVANSAAQVQIISRGQDAAILLLPAEESSPRQAADLFIERSKASVLQRESDRVNGMEAVQLLSEVSTEQTRLRVLSYFIRKNGRVFVFHGYTSVSLFDRYMEVFRNTMEQFDHRMYCVTERVLRSRTGRLLIKTKRSSSSGRAALM